MKRLNKIAVVFAVVLLLPYSVSGTLYYGIWGCGSPCYQADTVEKDGGLDRQRYTELFSGIAQYIGWTTLASNSSSRTDNPLSYYLKQRPNKRRAGFNLGWLFDSGKDTQGLRGWFPRNSTRARSFRTESFSKYFVEKETKPNGMSNSSIWHRDEYGSGLSINKVAAPGDIGHPRAPSQPVPEPGTMLLMGIGMLGLASSFRSRRQLS